MENISAIDLCKLLEDKTKRNIFIDVRSGAEHQNENIPDTLNIPLMGLLNRESELRDYDNIFVYCETGARSFAGCQYLSQLGIKNVYNLDGGITAWKMCKKKTSKN